MKLLLLFILPGLVLAQKITPTERVYQTLTFQDDLDFTHLEKAIDRQLENYQKRGLKGTIKFYPRTILKDSLIELKKL